MLIHALRRVAVLSSERSRAVKLELSDRRLVVSSNNPDLGEAQEELDVDYGGEPLTLGFNVRYLLDAVGALGAKEIRFGLRDGNSPAQLQPTDDPDALAVVMPMRLLTPQARPRSRERSRRLYEHLGFRYSRAARPVERQAALRQARRRPPAIPRVAPPGPRGRRGATPSRLGSGAGPARETGGVNPYGKTLR